jgi:exodeoxyribonuclease VII small subunit
MADLPPDIAALSFEEALAELESIVKRLESGATRLDDAISAYERGARLRQHCETRLKEAQIRVERIVLAPDGGVAVEPAAVE